MKKVIAFFVIIMLVASFGSQMVFSQGKKETVYGSINYDGFHGIEKGFMWTKRPEAKEIFEGRIPSGVDEIKTLDGDYFVKFVEGEYSSLDKNYIVFPKGEVIYKKNGHWFSSRCGNMIENWVKKDDVQIIEKIVEKIVEVEKPQPAPPVVIKDTVVHTTYIEENNIQRNNYYEDDIYYRPEPLLYWVTPIMYNSYGSSYYGQPMQVNQQQYNTYITNTSNYVCERSIVRPEHPQPKPEAPHASGPGGRGDEGNHTSGPGGRGDGATGDGNHAGGPDGSGNGNNNATGSGGRSSMSRNSGRISPISDVSPKSASTNNRGTASRSSYSTGNSRTNYSRNSRQSYSGGTGSNYRTNYNSGASRTSSANYRPSYNSGASRSSYASASRPSYSRQSSGGGGYNGGSRGSSTGRR